MPAAAGIEIRSSTSNKEGTDTVTPAHDVERIDPAQRGIHRQTFAA